MKAKILDEKVTVYSSMDLNTLPVVKLNPGDVIETSGATIKKSLKKSKGKEWVEIRLPDKRKGYIPALAKLFWFRNARLLQRVDVYEQPSQKSVVKSSYPKGSTVRLVGLVKKNDQDWVKIQAASGEEGFIEGNIKVRINPEERKKAGKIQMILGAALITLYVITLIVLPAGWINYLGIFGLAILLGGLWNWFNN